MAKLTINPEKKISRINREVYGHFSEHLGRCIYEGIYVGKDSPIKNENGMRTDVIEALKEIRVPVLRWPGGCFADEYHWRDGIGPKEERKKIVNTHWGGVWKTTASAPTNSLNCAASSAVKRMSTATLGAAPCRRCPSGWST